MKKHYIAVYIMLVTSLLIPTISFATDTSTRNSDLISIENSLQRILQSLGNYINTQAVIVTPVLTLEDSAKAAFYKDLYRCILNREPDTSGLQNNLAVRPDTTFETIYAGLFTSVEYVAKNKTNEQYIADLYTCILKREKDTRGATTWSNRLNGGATRASLVTSFVNSVEFKTGNGLRLSESLGYSLSNTLATYTPSQQYARVRLQNELYRCILGRNAEPTARDAWLALSSSTSLEKIYTRLFNSDEYINKNKSDADFIDDLYRCVLGRSPDPQGLNGWLSKIETGWTRLGLLNQIVMSKEFQTGRGSVLASKTGYQLISEKLFGGSWPQWRDMVEPFKAGIPITTKTVTPVIPCNGGTYATTPLLGDFWISRQYTNGCNTTWQLIGSMVTWSKTGLAINQVNTVFNPGPTGTKIGDGNVVTSAYDATAMDNNGTTWIAFVCTPRGYVPSSCLGPLKEDKTLDVSKTNVVIYGTSQTDLKEYQDSGGVPKIISFKKRVYIYWTDVRFRKGVAWQKNYTDTGNYLVTRGIELSFDSSGQRFYPKDIKGVEIKDKFFSYDNRSTIVFDRNLNDLRSNRVADITYVATDDTYLYGFGSPGGGDCLTPLSPAEGCYRNYISRTTDPLSYNTFGKEFIPDKYLPPLYQPYQRLVYRPDTDSTWLVGGRFVVQNEKYQNAGLPIPKADPAGEWAFPWPDNVLKPKK